jgi:hypothetical protein
MTEATLIAHSGTRKITREELQEIPAPPESETHKPISHAKIIEELTLTLSYRNLVVTRDEYAVSADGMRMFGVLDLNSRMNGFCFSIGVRNGNDKSMRFSMVAGLRVTVCDNMLFAGDFKPVLRKHTKAMEITDLIAVGIEKIQRNFDPMARQVEDWKARMLPDLHAKSIIYDACLAEKLFPRNLLPSVHRHYFTPEYDEFRPRTLWSLANAFTSAFKGLKPTSQFQMTAKLGAFLEKL